MQKSLSSHWPVYILPLIIVLALACKSGHGDSLSYLDQYAGQKPGAGIWSSEPLHTKLKDITGDRFDQFIKYMQSAQPLTKEGDVLYTLAPIDQDSTRGFAYILIDTKTGKLEASIYTTVQINHFQSPGEQFTLPSAISSVVDSLK